MKLRVSTLSVLVLLTLAMAIPLAMAAKPTDTGFDEYGYNYKARVFVGIGENWYRGKYGLPVWEEGDPYTYVGVYGPDHLVMKWSKAWDDARFHGGDWTPKAWCTNEWNGMFPGGSGETWQYKNIWVGARWDITGVWDLDFVLVSHYLHEMTVTNFDPLTMEFSGYGHYETDPDYTWLVSGTVSGVSISFTITYTGENAGYEVEANGSLDEIDGTSMSGTWIDSNAQSGSWSGSGNAQDGPYWRDGGYVIWGQFEVIQSHGTDGGGHHWDAHAIPTGLGGP